MRGRRRDVRQSRKETNEEMLVKLAEQACSALARAVGCCARIARIRDEGRGSIAPGKRNSAVLVHDLHRCAVGDKGGQNESQPARERRVAVSQTVSGGAGHVVEQCATVGKFRAI